MNEKSFPVYLDTEPIISMLSDEQLGQLFRALYPYWNDGERLLTDDKMVEMAFVTFANKLDLARNANARYSEQQRIIRRIGEYKGKSDEKENTAKELLAAFKDYRGTITDFRREYRKAYEEIGIMIEEPEPRADQRQRTSTNVTNVNGRDLNLTKLNPTKLNPTKLNSTKPNQAEKGSGAESRPEPVSDSEDVYPWEKDLVE